MNTHKSSFEYLEFTDIIKTIECIGKNTVVVENNTESSYLYILDSAEEQNIKRTINPGTILKLGGRENIVLGENIVLLNENEEIVNVTLETISKL